MKRLRLIVLATASVVASGVTRAAAQQLPPIRQITKLERVTPDSLALLSARSAIGMPGGQVMFDDLRGRRILLLDSTLSHAKAIADTTGATANAYGANFASLIRFRGDSALLIVPSTLSMFVIAPTGAIARTMAIPRPSDANALFGAWAEPAISAGGRLLYMGPTRLPGLMTINGRLQIYENGKPTPQGTSLLAVVQPIDSAAVVRTDLETRVLDTVTWARIPKFRRALKTDDQGFLSAIETTPDPLPVIDQWTVTRDGTIAMVRGQDFHIDWIDRAGKITPSKKIAFNWKKVDDAQKRELTDSTVKAWQADFSRAAGDGRRGGRGGNAVPQVALATPLTDLPDYVPPFTQHAVATDADDNIWIRTSELVDNRPVYYIVNRAGDVKDRVQLPAFRQVIGFGPGVVYLSVELAGGTVHLERARTR